MHIYIAAKTKRQTFHEHAQGNAWKSIQKHFSITSAQFGIKID